MSAVIQPDVELRFPVGRFQPPQIISPAQRSLWIAELAALPANLQQAVAGLRDSQLDTPYRPGGWTVRQVTHHLADSHINSYCRVRLALTEPAPVIKPYDEAAWAELPDARTAALGPSLDLLSGLHQRWTILLNSLDDDAFARTFTHPEMGEIRLDWTLGLYAWHSRHHVAHINALRRREDW